MRAGSLALELSFRVSNQENQKFLYNYLSKSSLGQKRTKCMFKTGIFLSGQKTVIRNTEFFNSFSVLSIYLYQEHGAGKEPLGLVLRYLWQNRTQESDKHHVG